MSLIPIMLGHQPRQLIDEDFVLALTPADFMTASPMMSRDYYRPWRQLSATTRDIGSTVSADKEKFEINLDVQHFTPEEISVKATEGLVIIEGKHEEQQDEHGFVSRQFTRRYVLPQNCNHETVESKLSSDGVLTVVAPRIPEVSNNERPVPITQTGPIRADIKETPVQGEPNGSQQ